MTTPASLYQLIPPAKTRIGAVAIEPGTPVASCDWRARWLRDHIFAGAEPVFNIRSERRPENNGEIQNIHTLCRKEFTLEGKTIRQARLYVTADDCYKVYLNGAFVGVGPAPSYVFAYHYNAYDVTAMLQAGANCVGVHVYYQGMHSLAYTSGDNLQGMMLQLEIDFDDGSSMCVVSDDTWRQHRSEASESRQVLGYQTSHSEHIDLRKLPVGWDAPGFDDSTWVQPLMNLEDPSTVYTLGPQSTPPVSVFNRRAREVVKKGEGRYFIDFGVQLTGETAFTVTGPVGHEVEIRHGEELSGPQEVRHEMRCNCDYREYCTLSGRADELLTFYEYKGFRYVEVLNWPEELTADRVWAHERHYPFAEDASRFESSDALLNDIWMLCRNGVRVGTLDVYLDCPTREKGGFLGDGFVTGISHLIASGDARLLRKFMRDVANTSRYCPGLHSTAPNYVQGELGEYSMLFPPLLEYYYQWTGDVAFVTEMMPIVRGMLEYYSQYENADGLLEDVFSPLTGKYAVLVDWPKNFRDDYDDIGMGQRLAPGEPKKQAVNTMLHGFYINALRGAERLAAVVNDVETSKLIAGKADRVIASAQAKLVDPTTRLFVDRVGSTHSSYHANVSALMSGMAAEEDVPALLALVKQKRIACGVYFSWFVLKALCNHGESDFAYELMTAKDPHSWHAMLESGATTCLEAWQPDLKWNTSFCHPWSSSPIYMLTHEMLGLRPSSPGWSSIEFAPAVPPGLDGASIKLTVPPGEVSAGFERVDGKVRYWIDVPEECRAVCRLPGETVKVDAGMHSVLVDASRVG